MRAPATKRKNPSAGMIALILVGVLLLALAVAFVVFAAKHFGC